MLVGGAALALVGLLAGEASEVDIAHCTWRGIYSFMHLLIFGSLVGFVAYNWLLGQVSAAKAGTYAYVNPVIAVLVGWLLGGEALTGWVLAGMAVILLGVALVKMGGHTPREGVGLAPEIHEEDGGAIDQGWVCTPAAGAE